ncbi:MAG: cyclic nucleotide-binding domain-containing protein [Desulfobacteraceae bacterium]
MKSMRSEPNGHDAVDQDLVQAVLPFADKMVCKQGEELIVTGEQAECFYYVEKGTFEVSYTSQKTAIVVALIGPQSIFGEIGFFDQMTRTRNIHAIEDAQVRIFNQQVMAAIREHDPEIYSSFMEFLLRSVCTRFRQILADRGPLTAYAASLSTGREQFQGLQPLPADLLGSAGWQKVNRQIEDFKAAVFDLSYRLQKDTSEKISGDLLSEGMEVLDTFNQRLDVYEDGIPSDYMPLMWGYAFKELFPYFMRSRLAERAYYKPKGYAGDFELIELIYRNKPEGDGKLGRLIDGWLLNRIPCQAVRNRRRLLKELLDQFCRERLDQDKERGINIMNLACGPCRELFDLLSQCDYSAQINALCIDIDADALQYADQHVNTARHHASVRFMRENVIKWALGRARQDLPHQDIIYSSGLCDYLDHRIMLRLLERCYDQLVPGGALIIGNFAPSNPDRDFMDNIVYWRLIHRDERAMRELIAESSFGDNVQLISEKHGVNLFAIATKP